MLTILRFRIKETFQLNEMTQLILKGSEKLWELFCILGEKRATELISSIPVSATSLVLRSSKPLQENSHGDHPKRG